MQASSRFRGDRTVGVGDDFGDPRPTPALLRWSPPRAPGERSRRRRLSFNRSFSASSRCVLAAGSAVPNVLGGPAARRLVLFVLPVECIAGLTFDAVYGRTHPARSSSSATTGPSGRSIATSAQPAWARWRVSSATPESVCGTVNRSIAVPVLSTTATT